MKKRSDAVDIHVGARIRMRRMMLGITQRQLADKIKTSFQQVQKYEKGANRVGGSKLYRIAHALGVDVQFFFEEFKSQSGDHAVQNVPSSLTDEDIAALKALHNIKSSMRRRQALKILLILGEDESG